MGEESIVTIVKGKDEYKYSIEVTNANSKFEPQVTVKVRSDDDAEGAATLAAKIFTEKTKELKTA